MDFTESFKAGLKKARQIKKRAEELNNDIRDVFIDLNEKIGDVSDDILFIYYEENKGMYNIIAKNQTNESSEKLGHIAIDRYGGYLCTLSYNNKSFCCYDKDCLVIDLNVMLQNINVSGKLLSLLESSENGE